LLLNFLYINLCDFDGSPVIQRDSGGIVGRHHAIGGPLAASIRGITALDLQADPGAVLSLDKPVVVTPLRSSINVRKTLVLDDLSDFSPRRFNR